MQRLYKKKTCLLALVSPGHTLLPVNSPTRAKCVLAAEYNKGNVGLSRRASKTPPTSVEQDPLPRAERGPRQPLLAVFKALFSGDLHMQLQLILLGVARTHRCA